MTELRAIGREIAATVLCAVALVALWELWGWILDRREARRGPEEWGQPGRDPEVARVLEEAREITRQAAERPR